MMHDLADANEDQQGVGSTVPGLNLFDRLETAIRTDAAPDRSGPLVAAIDVGGTNLKMGLSDLAGKFVFIRKLPAREMGTGRAAVPRLANLARQMIQESGLPPGSITGIGLVVPGVTDPELGMVSLAPAFGWQNLPIRDLLRDELGTPVYVENDVNAAALAEKRWGVGREFHDFVFLSLGTGIGAGIILNGQLYRGHLHAAGEVGNVIIDFRWLKQEHDRSDLGFGCLESLAGALGIIRRAEELGGIGKWHHGAIEHTAEDVFDAARAGEPVASRVLEEVTDYLAVGIVNIAVLISPEAVVLGGGVARAGETLLAPLRAKVARWSPVQPIILQSSFHAEPGLVGAASLAASHAGGT